VSATKCRPLALCARIGFNARVLTEPEPQMTTWITICDTCKREGWETGAMASTDGEALAALIETAAEAQPAVRTRRVSCTMGCERACNIIVQGAGKIGYSLGRFEPTLDDAEAIVAYAALHAQSETGQVPFREWPQGVKGHFVSRQTPLPE
jgi:predicted metal-binding protein